MHSYRERLRAPVSWWITGMAVMFTFASIVWFGFPLWVALVTYVTLLGITGAFLANWGRATIEIYGGELFAGGRQLSLADAGEVRPLAEAQARALGGPRADPHAYLLIRPYLRKAVYVEVTAPDSDVPYWLLFTRHPAELAAAIESSRPADRADSTAMG
ncbi:MAG TPA: DUF3093 domain-containing protein [Streptosporangiaceae bacterium]|nr:DUF3093 domain-containing protein [Streptosporangiaceae bacterium]